MISNINDRSAYFLIYYALPATTIPFFIFFMGREELRVRSDADVRVMPGITTFNAPLTLFPPQEGPKFPVIRHNQTSESLR